MIHTRAFGRPRDGFEARVVDEQDRDLRVRDGRGAARALGRRRGSAPRLLLRLPEERRGHPRGVARRVVPHRRRGAPDHRRHADLRRPQEEHHPALGREHRGRGGRGRAPGPRGGGPGGGARGARRAPRGRGHGLRGADARRQRRTRPWPSASATSASSASPTSRPPAGCSSSRASRPPGPRRSRRPRSSPGARIPAAALARWTSGRARSAADPTRGAPRQAGGHALASRAHALICIPWPLPSAPCSWAT